MVRLKDDQKTMQFLTTLGAIMTHIASAEIGIQHYLIDYRFKDPNLNNHFRRVKKGLNAIKSHFNRFSKVKDKDEFDYDYSIEFYRATQHFTKMSTEQLKEYADGIDEVIKK